MYSHIYNSSDDQPLENWKLCVREILTQVPQGQLEITFLSLTASVQTQDLSVADSEIIRIYTMVIIEQHCSQQEPQRSHMLEPPPSTHYKRKVRKLITFQ